MKVFLFAAVSLITATSSLAADEPQRLELATRLVRAMRIADRNSSPLSDALPKLKETNPKTDAFWQAVTDENAKLYAEAFTSNELQQLVAFFASPIGQTFITKHRDILIKARQSDSARIMELLKQSR